jgi:hypothetical protein
VKQTPHPVVFVIAVVAAASSVRVSVALFQK